VDGSREWFLGLFDTNLYEGLANSSIPPRKIEAVVAQLGEELNRAAGQMRSFPLMPDVLNELGRRHRLLVITSSISAVVEALLRRDGVTGVAEVLGAEKETSKVRKIRRAMAETPSRVPWYVGDTCGDIDEGRAAGAATAAVTWGWHSAERLLRRRPDAVIRQPRELLDVLG